MEGRQNSEFKHLNKDCFLGEFLGENIQVRTRKRNYVIFWGKFFHLNEFILTFPKLLVANFLSQIIRHFYQGNYGLNKNECY